MQDRNFLQCSEMRHVLSRNARPPSTPYVLFIVLFVVNEGKHELENALQRDTLIIDSD